MNDNLLVKKVRMQHKGVRKELQRKWGIRSNAKGTEPGPVYMSQLCKNRNEKTINLEYSVMMEG